MLMRFNIPIVFLTATLPPRLTPHFYEAVGFPHDSVEIRAQTNRLEHIYSLKSISSDKEGFLDATAKLARKLAADLTGLERGLVFARQIGEGHKLSAALGAPFISSNMSEDSERARCFREWRDGQNGGLLVGTSSLMQGVHYDHVKFVIFALPPWGLVDLVQGAGRAGRDGKPARVIVATYQGLDPPRPRDQFDSQCNRELSEWLHDEGCLRKVISSTMDGKQKTCGDLNGAERCDRCGSGDEVIQAACTFALDKEATIPEMNTGLTPYLSQVEGEPTQLTMPPLRPRAPHRSVVQHSVNTLDAINRLKVNTIQVFERVRGVGETCGVCWFLENKKKGKPPGRHQSMGDCAKYRGARLDGFEQFYDYKSPKKGKVQHYTNF